MIFGRVARLLRTYSSEFEIFYILDVSLLSAKSEDMPQPLARRIWVLTDLVLELWDGALCSDVPLAMKVPVACGAANLGDTSFLRAGQGEETLLGLLVAASVKHDGRSLFGLRRSLLSPGSFAYIHIINYITLQLTECNKYFVFSEADSRSTGNSSLLHGTC
jgi:hypothetical protein